MGGDRLAAAVEGLWEVVRELSLGTSSRVDVLDAPPWSSNFLRDYVSASKPCLLRGVAADWPAVARWSCDSHLVTSFGQFRPVTLHLTPDGRADALAPFPAAAGGGDCRDLYCFASACVRRVPFAVALDLVAASGRCPSTRVAVDAQDQDDWLMSSGKYGGSALVADAEEELRWATAALGCPPVEVSIWMGNGRSETSFHKDHYENFYAVVTGEKHFILLPPTDVHRLYVRSYPAARYVPSTSATAEAEVGELLEQGLRLEVEVPRREVPWCSVDPYPRTPEEASKARKLFPLYFEGPPPFQCTVRAGDILYVPSMWFYHVRHTPDSSGRTIAVNYRYGMEFDIKYAYFNFLQSIEFPPAGNGDAAEPCEEVDDDDDRPSHSTAPAGDDASSH